MKEIVRAAGEAGWKGGGQGVVQWRVQENKRKRRGKQYREGSNNPAVCNNRRRTLPHERARARAFTKQHIWTFWTRRWTYLNSSARFTQSWLSCRSFARARLLARSFVSTLTRVSHRRHVDSSMYYVLIISSDWTRLVGRRVTAVSHRLIAHLTVLLITNNKCIVTRKYSDHIIY